MEQYEQPGGNVRSKVPSEKYKDNYDAIFRKDKTCMKCGKNWTVSDGVYSSVICPNCGEQVDSTN